MSISKIRQKSGLLIVLIATALGGFILMDIMDARKSGGLMNNSSTLAKVDGQKIDYKEFGEMERVLYANSQADSYTKRFNIWNYFLENAIVSAEAEKIGLGVGKEELNEVEFGNNLSNIIIQRFQDQSTGQVNREQLAQIKQAIESNQLPADLKAFWKEQEKEVIKDRLQTKILNLVSKGVYTPTWMMEQNFLDMNQKLDFNYVRVTYDKVNDNEVKVTDEDMKKYLNEFKSQYKNVRESRRLGYLAFQVKASPADTAKIKDELAKLIPDFTTAPKDSLFVETNDGTIDDTYYSKSTLGAVADSAANGAVGTVVGPYFENGVVAIMKILGKTTIADSVKSRHILLQAKSPDQFVAAQKTIDSLKLAIESGSARFDSLATKFGQDATATKGGDLGYATPGRMVKEFNNLIFFQADKGKLYTVKTQFGVHLVEVMDKKFGKNEMGIKMASIRRPIVPSDETIDRTEEFARKFLEGNRTVDALTKEADKSGLKLETAQNVGENDFSLGQLGGNQTSRDIVRWMYNSKTRVGDVAPELYAYQDEALYYTNKFVIAALKAIQKPGIPDVAGIREEIEPVVKNLKKGEILKAKIKSKDLNAVAAEYFVRVDTVKGIAFAQQFIQGLGNEPKVMAKAFGMQVGAVSDPIIGTGGVYMIKPTNKPAPENQMMNNPAIRSSMAMSMRNQVKSRLVGAMKDNADVKDYRSNFF